MLVNASVKIGNLYYDLNDQSLMAEVVYHPNYEYKGDIVIPSYITYNNKTYTVTSISNSAFSYNDITSLTIPETITNIKKTRTFSRWRKPGSSFSNFALEVVSYSKMVYLQITQASPA